MTCKDCIHYDVCTHLRDSGERFEQIVANCGCRHFKDKSRFIELPCKVGDIVFVTSDGLISEQRVTEIDIEILKTSIATECARCHECDQEDAETPCMCDSDLCIGYYSDYEFERRVFFTYEDAEKALKERNEKCDPQ